MLRWLSILVVALALVAAGCGGSGNESAATDETTTEETTTTDETTTEESTDTAVDRHNAISRGHLGNEDCVALAGVGRLDRTGVLRCEWIAETHRGPRRAREQGSRGDPGPMSRLLAEALGTYAAKIKDIGIEPGTDAECRPAPAAPGCDHLAGSDGADRSLAAHRGLVEGELQRLIPQTVQRD